MQSSRSMPSTAKKYRDAAVKIGLTGKMVHALPGILLQKRLDELAGALGPLPHARLNIERGADNRGPADRPKKQGTRMLKGECATGDCGYTVRVAAKWVKDVGPPHCPKHGAMMVDLPEDEGEDGSEAGEMQEAV